MLGSELSGESSTSVLHDIVLCSRAPKPSIVKAHVKSNHIVIMSSVAYPGFQRGGVLKVRPHTKSGGGGGGQSTSGPIYEKWGGGGGGQSASGPIPLFGTQKILYR